MDAQVGIIRNHAVANGTEYIVEFVALLHQAVLYQLAESAHVCAYAIHCGWHRKARQPEAANAPTISE